MPLIGYVQLISTFLQSVPNLKGKLIREVIILRQEYEHNFIGKIFSF